VAAYNSELKNVSITESHHLQVISVAAKKTNKHGKYFLPRPASQTSFLLEHNLVLATKHEG
jgi:hypothetical protein